MFDCRLLFFYFIVWIAEPIKDVNIDPQLWETYIIILLLFNLREAISNLPTKLHRRNNTEVQNTR